MILSCVASLCVPAAIVDGSTNVGGSYRMICAARPLLLIVVGSDLKLPDTAFTVPTDENLNFCPTFFPRNET